MKLFFISLIFLFLTYPARSQVNDLREKSLTLTKVYGLVKYYNNEKDDSYLDLELIKVFPKLNDPDYSTKNFNADLLTLLPEDQRVLNANIELKDLFDQFKGLEHVRTIDFSWIDQDKMLNEDNKKLLWQLINSHKYVSNSNMIGNQGLVHYEINDSNPPSNTDQYLLGLIKFWNVIEYFFPYKLLMDEDWDKVFYDAIPEFHSINSDEAYSVMLKKLSAKLNDSQVSVEDNQISNNETFKLPFSIVVVDDNLVIQSINDSLLTLYHANTGDVINVLDGLTYSELWQEYSELVSFSSPQAGKSLFKKYLGNRFNHKDGIVLASIVSNNNVHQESINTVTLDDYEEYEYLYDEDGPFPDINENIGYIPCSDIGKSIMNKIIKRQEHLHFMILDCRGSNPQVGLLPILHFLGNNKAPYAKYYKPSFQYPGIFDYPEVRMSNNLKIGKAYKGRLFVLINEDALSSMESLLMEIKIRRSDAVFIGSPTQGCNGQMNLMVLPGEKNIWFTGGGDWRYPDDSQLQRIGIQPDILVEPSVESIRNKEDAILEFAIDYISKFI